jgi:hypothetical protein
MKRNRPKSGRRFDLDDLLHRAQQQGLLEDDLEVVLNALDQRPSESATCALLEVLKWGADGRLAKRVEPYLSDVGEPMINRMALDVLAHWQVLDRYENTYSTWIARGRDFDPDNIARQMAILTVGSELRRGVAPLSLLAALVAATEDPDELVQEDAYMALEDALSEHPSLEMPRSRIEPGSRKARDLKARAQAAIGIGTIEPP